MYKGHLSQVFSWIYKVLYRLLGWMVVCDRHTRSAEQVLFHGIYEQLRVKDGLLEENPTESN